MVVGAVGVAVEMGADSSKAVVELEAELEAVGLLTLAVDREVVWEPKNPSFFSCIKCEGDNMLDTTYKGCITQSTYSRE